MYHSSASIHVITEIGRTTVQGASAFRVFKAHRKIWILGKNSMIMQGKGVDATFLVRGSGRTGSLTSQLSGYSQNVFRERVR